MASSVVCKVVGFCREDDRAQTAADLLAPFLSGIYVSPGQVIKLVREDPEGRERRVCCLDFAEACAKRNGLEQLEDGWAVSGCCGGGCYVLTGLKHCPFCGKVLPG